MLNIEQEKIINSKYNKIFVNAGAGTGKTFTIISKINKLLDEGVNPSDILCISFTNKSAQNLKQRLKNDNVVVKTFHKFIYDYLKSMKIINHNILSDNINFNINELNKISKYKNGQIRFKPILYNDYQAYLKNNNLIDFDDIFNKFLDCSYDKKIKYLFLDEFQDTNPLQYKVIKKLTDNNSYILAVGDIKQAIYSFRGSDKNIISKFVKEYSAQVLNLRINYRSKKNLVIFFNKIIKQRFDFKFIPLIPSTKEDGKIYVLKFLDGIKEARYIVEKIKYYLLNGYKKSDIAIITRDIVRANIIKSEIFKSYLNISEDSNKINILTIHKAKGLEFEIVFLVGLEKSFFPKKIENTYKNFIEEKRLFYVGITRCKKILHLSYCKVFNDKYYMPSIFYYESLFKKS